MQKMFVSPRFCTQEIQREVGIDLLIHLWNLIDCRRELYPDPLDYLQVFELSTMVENGETLQIVVHRQEQPPFVDTHHYRLIEKPLKTVI